MINPKYKQFCNYYRINADFFNINASSFNIDADETSTFDLRDRVYGLTRFKISDVCRRETLDRVRLLIRKLYD